MKATGYPTPTHLVKTKRYCQTLDLKNDPDLIQTYINRHSQAEAWPEILAGIRSVGILNMEIYLVDNRLFMVVDTPLDFDWDQAFTRLAGMPRQQEWEAYMSVFQQADPQATSSEKWKQMKRIFQLETV